MSIEHKISPGSYKLSKIIIKKKEQYNVISIFFLFSKCRVWRHILREKEKEKEGKSYGSEEKYIICTYIKINLSDRQNNKIQVEPAYKNIIFCTYKYLPLILILKRITNKNSLPKVFSQDIKTLFYDNRM